MNDKQVLDPPQLGRGWTVVFDVDGPYAAGALQLSGFATKRTALQVGARVADALREEFRAEVRATIGRAMHAADV